MDYSRVSLTGAATDVDADWHCEACRCSDTIGLIFTKSWTTTLKGELFLRGLANNLTAAVCVRKTRMQGVECRQFQQLQCVLTSPGCRGQIGIPGQCFDQGLQEAIVVDDVPHIQDTTHCVSLARPCIAPRLYADNMHPYVASAHSDSQLVSRPVL